MAGSTLNQFQVKDLYQPLHPTEEYYLKGLDVKKPAQFTDVILAQHANDPYYHKNTYNLSQSIHHINYIVHEWDEPFGRPELDEAYMNTVPPRQTDPPGSVIFYPSFLTGQFIDNPKRERVFEKMLLRIKDDFPSEQQQIQSLLEQIEETDKELAILRSDIDYRLNTLKEKKETVENFYRNICHWFFLGELKNPDENAGIFFEGRALTGPFDASKIDGLLSIHNKVGELDKETKASLTPLVNTFESEYSKDKNQETKDTLEKQQKEIKEMEEINKRVEAELILQEAKYQSFRENFNKNLVLATKIRKDIKDFLDKYYDSNTNTSKIDDINYCPKLNPTDQKLSWYQPSGSDLSSKDLSKAWAANINEDYYNQIQQFNQELREAYDCIYAKREAMNGTILQLKANLKKLQDIGLADETDKENEKKVQKVYDDVENILNLIIKKMLEHSNYNLYVDFLKEKKIDGRPFYGPNIIPGLYMEYEIIPKDELQLLLRFSYTKQYFVLRKKYFNELGEEEIGKREIFEPVKDISSPYLLLFKINDSEKYYIDISFKKKVKFLPDFKPLTTA